MTGRAPNTYDRYCSFEFELVTLPHDNGQRYRTGFGLDGNWLAVVVVVVFQRDAATINDCALYLSSSIDSYLHPTMSSSYLEAGPEIPIFLRST